MQEHPCKHYLLKLLSQDRTQADSAFGNLCGELTSIYPAIGKKEEVGFPPDTGWIISQKSGCHSFGQGFVDAPSLSSVCVCGGVSTHITCVSMKLLVTTMRTPRGSAFARKLCIRTRSVLLHGVPSRGPNSEQMF